MADFYFIDGRSGGPVNLQHAVVQGPYHHTFRDQYSGRLIAVADALLEPTKYLILDALAGDVLSLQGAMARGNVNPWPIPSSVYLPTVGAAPSAVYAARRIVAAYSGNLAQVQRASDNATLDVAQDANGLPDYAAVVAWAAGSQTRLRTVYDQSGNGRNKTRTVWAQMPLFDAVGARGQAAAFGSIKAFMYDGYYDGVSTRVPKSMDVPNTVTPDLRNHSIFAVLEPKNAIYTELYWSLLTTGAAEMSSISTFATRPLRIGGGGNNSDFPKRPRQGYQVIGQIGGASSFRVVQDNAVINVGPQKWVETGAGILIGDGPVPSTDFLAQDNFLAFVVYPAALSDADALAVNHALNGTFGLTNSLGRLVTMVGSSSLYGATVTESLEGRTISRLIRGNLSPDTALYNMAISAQTIATMRANSATREFLLPASGSFASKLLYVQIGSNDFASGRTAAQFQADVTSYIADARAAGYDKFVIQTQVKRQQTAQAQAEADAWNAWVRQPANYRSIGVDAVADFASQPQIAAAALTDTALWQDQIHPTGYANTLLAPIAAAAINSV